MEKTLVELSESERWRLMVDAAKAGMAAQGYSLARVPGRGMSNVWNVTKDGETRMASIRTTRDRYIAFPPLEGGTKWKTLDDVEMVAVATVDSKDAPEKVEVYLFPADDVRQRFNAQCDDRCAQMLCCRGETLPVLVRLKPGLPTCCAQQLRRCQINGHIRSLSTALTRSLKLVPTGIRTPRSNASRRDRAAVRRREYFQGQSPNRDSNPDCIDFKSTASAGWAIGGYCA